MFCKTNNRVTYFKSENARSTEKMFTGRVSVRIKNGEGEDGKPIYSYDSWNVRFVGKAKALAETLESKTVIVLKDMIVRCPYDKEKDEEYPYLVVKEFEIYGQENNDNNNDKS